jgi:hypothetical protein
MTEISSLNPCQRRNSREYLSGLAAFGTNQDSPLVLNPKDP